MLVAAANSARPTAYTQNRCPGIQLGTTCAMSWELAKCSPPNAASDAGTNTRPRTGSASSLADRCVRTAIRPATRNTTPASCGQKVEVTLGNYGAVGAIIEPFCADRLLPSIESI